MDNDNVVNNYVLREINDDIYILVGIYDNTLIEIDYEASIVYKALRDLDRENAKKSISCQLNINESETNKLINDLVSAI